MLYNCNRKLRCLCKLLQQHSIELIKPFVLVRRAKSTGRRGNVSCDATLDVSPVPVEASIIGWYTLNMYLCFL